MAKRKLPFAHGEYYHCFNRGVDKRKIFIDAKDFNYFLTALQLFNQASSKGDMVHYKQRTHAGEMKTDKESLVSVVSYCLNPNHFHLLLRQEAEEGVSKFLQKISTGYTMYFNKKYERTGSLFQGKFKAVHVNEDAQLRHLFAYVTQNNMVHKIDNPKKYRNSYTEVIENGKGNICNKELIYSCLGAPIKLKDVIKTGISHTIAHRASLEDKERSQFLE